MKFRYILLIATLMLSKPLYAIDYQIVGHEVCRPMGSILIGRCDRQKLTLNLDQAPEYVNQNVTVSIVRSGNCSTPYPVTFNLKASGGRTFSTSGLLEGEYLFSQANSQSVEVSVTTPYSAIATYRKTCEITAKIEKNFVFRDVLAQDLSALKSEAESDIAVLNDRIADKSTIGSLLQVVGLYEELIDLADADAVSFAQMNQTLADNCDMINPCTWSDQISVLLNDPYLVMPFDQMFLLYNLAIQLDALVPAGCTTGNCVSGLIDPETRAIIDSIMDSIDYSNVEDDVKDLIEQLLIIEELIEEYKIVAQDYGIDWNAL